MAVVNTKSTIVTNADATPRVHTPLKVAEGKLHEQVATVEVAAADDDGSVFRLFRVLSTWRVSSLEVLNDAITGGAGYDVGVYDTAENGGAVVDDDVFASAVSMATARVAWPVDVAFEAADIANGEKAIWELLGLSSDPQKYYDIALTGDTVGTAAGTITGRLRYVRGD